MFQEKVMASSCVINGFGKTMGLVQVEELGTIETPIIMTNTLSVGTALTASVKYMLEKNPDIGVETGTVNCVVNLYCSVVNCTAQLYDCISTVIQGGDIIGLEIYI